MNSQLINWIFKLNQEVLAWVLLVWLWFVRGEEEEERFGYRKEIPEHCKAIFLLAAVVYITRAMFFPLKRKNKTKLSHCRLENRLRFSTELGCHVNISKAAEKIASADEDHAALAKAAEEILQVDIKLGLFFVKLLFPIPRTDLLIISNVFWLSSATVMMSAEGAKLAGNIGLQNGSRRKRNFNSVQPWF